jgi:hypothetical protein
VSVEPGRTRAKVPVGAVLAPRAVPAQLSPRVGVPTVVRVLLGLVALGLTVWFLDISIAGAVHGLHDPASLDTVGQQRNGAIIASYLAILVVSGLALAASWGVGGIRAGGFPRGAAAAAGQLFTGTAALVYVPLVICTTLQVVLAVAGDVPASHGIESSVGVGLVTSLGSGVSEEVFVVAVPIAVFDAFVRWRPNRLPWLPTAVTVTVLAAARLSYHVYYGWTALVLLPWAVLSVVVYLRTRAIAPLMICHVAYDAVLQLPGGLGLLGVLALAVVAAVAGARLVRRTRTAAASPMGAHPMAAYPMAPSLPRMPPEPPWGLSSAPPGPGRGPTAPFPSGPPGRSGPR